MALKKVLIVDPVADDRAIFRAALEHHGYRVEDAADGPSGYAAASASHPDLILLAFPVRMSDGRTLLETLRADPELSGIPLLAVTPEGEPEDARRVWRLGCDDHCTKPVQPRVLAVQVHQMIGPSLPD